MVLCIIISKYLKIFNFHSLIINTLKGYFNTKDTYYAIKVKVISKSKYILNGVYIHQQNRYLSYHLFTKLFFIIVLVKYYFLNKHSCNIELFFIIFE